MFTQLLKINLALIFKWQFFATLIQADRFMKIRYREFCFEDTYLLEELQCNS